MSCCPNDTLSYIPPSETNIQIRVPIYKGSRPLHRIRYIESCIRPFAIIYKTYVVVF